MDFENERLVISQDFQAFLASQTAMPVGTPVDWNNIGFKQPVNAPWLRFNIVPGATSSAALGAQMTRSMGIMAVQIFYPGQSGTKFCRTVGDAIATYFNFRQLAVARGILHFQVCSVEDYGHNDGFYQMNANAPFWRDTRLDLTDQDGGTITQPQVGSLDGGTL